MSCCSVLSRRGLGAGGGLLAAAAGLFAAVYATAHAGPAPTPLAPTPIAPLAGPHADQEADTVLDHKVQALNGAEVDLSKYRGKVVLIVNVASQCGFTKQYKPLQTVYERFEDEGLVILGFPSNQFGGQEPGSPAEIAAFCEKNYGVEFPLMGKVEVNGPGATPLYRELTAEGATDDPGPVKWNFEKFLVGRDGKVIARYRTKVSPDSDKVLAAIKKALKEEAPAADAPAAETAQAD